MLRRPGNGDNNGKCIKLTNTRSLSCLPFLSTTSVNFFQLLDWFPYTCIYQANNEKVGSLYLHKHCTCIYNTFINQHDQTLWGRVRTTQTAPIFPWDCRVWLFYRLPSWSLDASKTGRVQTILLSRDSGLIVLVWRGRKMSFHTVQVGPFDLVWEIKKKEGLLLRG